MKHRSFAEVKIHPLNFFEKIFPQVVRGSVEIRVLLLKVGAYDGAIELIIFTVSFYVFKMLYFSIWIFFSNCEHSFGAIVILLVLGESCRDIL